MPPTRGGDRDLPWNRAKQASRLPQHCCVGPTSQVTPSPHHKRSSVMADRYELRLPSLRVKQAGRDLYSFAVDGKRLHDFATVSRIHREDETRLKGYQRPEVLSHIRSIRRYLESTSPLLPNAIVIAFDD